MLLYILEIVDIHIWLVSVSQQLYFIQIENLNYYKS